MLTPVGVVVRFLHLFMGTALWGILLVLVEAQRLILDPDAAHLWLNRGSSACVFLSAGGLDSILRHRGFLGCGPAHDGAGSGRTNAGSHAHQAAQEV